MVVVNPLRYTEPGPLAVAHRGGAGLAVENTLTALATAHAPGVRWMESDVQVTADGVAVLHHDRTLRRLFGVRARLGQLTWAQARVLRTPGGERLPRPVEVFDAFGDARFTLDVKDPWAVDGLLRDVRAARFAAQVCLAGATDEVLAAAAAREPEMSTALGWRTLVGLVARARFGSPWPGCPAGGRARYAHVPDRLFGTGVLSASVVARAGDLGLAVLARTVDSPARMRELLDLGAGGIITDRPDLLLEVLRGRGALACERNLASWVQ